MISWEGYEFQIKYQFVFRLIHTIQLEKMIFYDEALLGEIISSKIPFYCIMEILSDFIEKFVCLLFAKFMKTLLFIVRICTLLRSSF